MVIFKTIIAFFELFTAIMKSSCFMWTPIVWFVQVQIRYQRGQSLFIFHLNPSNRVWPAAQNRFLFAMIYRWTQIWIELLYT